MKKVGKKIISVVLAMTMLLSLAACGGNKEDTTQTDTSSFVYIPSFAPLDDEEYSNCITMDGNSLYYAMQIYDEESETSTWKVNKVDLATNEKTECPVTVSENGYISAMNLDTDGNLVYLENIHEYDPETYTMIRNEMWVKKIDAQGNELLNVDVSFVMESSEYMYISSMEIDDDNNIYLGVEDGVSVLSPEGSALFMVSSQDFILAVGKLKDGRVFTTSYSYTGSGIELNIIDVEKQSYGDTYSGIPDSNNSILVPGNEHDFLICGNSALFGYDLATQTTTRLVDWLDCEIDSDNIRAISMMENGDVKLVLTEYAQSSTTSQIVTLTKTDASSVAQKITLTLGTMYLDDSTKSQVLAFNRENPEYRIRIKDYSEEAEYETALTNFNNDVTSSNNCPDIMDISSLRNYKQLAQKNVFEDLYPYLENDPEINLDDYVSNVLTAYDVEGTLISLIPSFYPNTVLGRTSEVGTEMGWTIDEMMAFIQAHPEAEVFEYTTKTSMLTDTVSNDMDTYIDPATNECNFNGAEFIALLEMCNTFPEEIDWDSQESLPSRIASGKQLLIDTTFSDIPQFQMYSLMFNEPVTFIGYPTSSGNGSLIVTTEANYAISSKCEYKDAAWEYVKACLTDEYQESLWWGFPVKNSALQAIYDEAMEVRTYTDENGEVIEEVHTTWGYDDVEFSIFAATPEQIDQIDTLIRSLDTVASYDEEMFAIIMEEADVYFSGAKTAQEVADIIQSRISIYLSENY